MITLISDGTKFHMISTCKHLAKIFLFSAYFTGVMYLSAQNSQIEQSRQTGLRGPDLSDLGLAEEEETGLGDVPSTEGDEDLGVQQLLRQQIKYKAFSVFGDVAGLYTTNVALASEGAEDDFFIIGTVGGSWTPQVTEGLFVDVSANQQFYRYNEFDALDFNSTNAGVGVTYVAKDLENLISFVRYNYNILTDTEDWEEIFSEHTVQVGTVFPWQLDRAQRVTAGIDATFGWADPDDSQRNEYAFQTGYDARISRWFSLSLFYRVAFNDYTTSGRDDLNQNFSLTASFLITDWMTVRATTSAGINSSNQDVFDYDVLTPGGNLTFDYQF